MIFKCKNCSGNTIYSPELHAMYCPYCSSENTEERKNDAYNIEVCPDCGGELAIEQYTSALQCKYCNNYINNLMLAAHELGIGSCWIHRAKEEFERPEGKALLAELGIEGDYEGIGHCILGYVDGNYPEARPRKENWVYWAE